MLLVGSLPELGGWQVARARELRWQHSHWVAAMDLEPGGAAFEFKFAVRRGTELVWQDGPNRRASAPARGTKGLDVDVPRWESPAVSHTL